MPASVRWAGLDELREALGRLPAELADEASTIIRTHAEGAQQEIIAGYPEVSGHLRGGVRITLSAFGRYGTNVVLKSSAPHAWMYEHGTVKRAFHGTDALGRVYDKKPDRGTMPAAPLDRQAIPKIIRWRVRMYAALAAMLERHGLVVSGSFGGSRAA